jgi:GTP diphosphokinase / guanosine-3',5'-bis(diphosphate) 3'-diphosphatase
MDESLYRGFDERTQSFFKELEAVVDKKTPQRAILRKYLTDEVRRELHLGKKDVNEIRKAFNTAFYAYHGILRRSGEAYIFHAVRCVLIATWILAMCGIYDRRLLLILFLHDTYEETGASWYSQLFVRMLVHLGSGFDVGTYVGHLSKKEGESDENYFKRLLVCGLWLVIMSKFVDRIDNVRTLDGTNPQRDGRKIAETEQWFPQLEEVLEKLITKDVEAGRLEEGWLKAATFLSGYLQYKTAEMKRLIPT